MVKTRNSKTVVEEEDHVDVDAKPTTKRGLKRSASVASLLTPPRTINRPQKRGTRHIKNDSVELAGSGQISPRSTRSSPRSRTSVSGLSTTSTDGGDDESVFGSAGRKFDFSRKKRRVGEINKRLEALIESIDDGDAEDVFWTGPSATAKEEDDKGKDKEVEKKAQRARSPSPLRVTTVRAPVSPPPSKRNKRVGRRTVKAKEQELPPLPSTPKGKTREELPDSPIRDSGNNPFLVDDDSPASVTAEPIEPRTPTAYAEKPTVTYVFRGKRATFANPMYNLSPEVHARSLLPVEHPDYSPDPACPPRLLFPSAHKRKPPSTPTRSSKRIRAKNDSPSVRRTGDWQDSDGEEDILNVSPPRRLFH